MIFDLEARGLPLSAPSVLAVQRGEKWQTRRVVKIRPFDSGGGKNQTPTENYTKSVRIGMFSAEPEDHRVPQKFSALFESDRGGDILVDFPYGKGIGQQLYVKEGIERGEWGDRDDAVIYSADKAFMWDVSEPATWVWKRNYLPSIFCGRSCSRTLLEITRVRVERLDQITQQDCMAEGIKVRMFDLFGATAAEATNIYRAHYFNLWNELNASRGFGTNFNPWVWVIDFKKVQSE